MNFLTDNKSYGNIYTSELCFEKHNFFIYI